MPDRLGGGHTCRACRPSVLSPTHLARAAGKLASERRLCPPKGAHLLPSLNPFPGGGQLYQNPVLADPNILVELNEVPGSGHHGVLVKGEPARARVHVRGGLTSGCLPRTARGGSAPVQGAAWSPMSRSRFSMGLTTCCWRPTPGGTLRAQQLPARPAPTSHPPPWRRGLGSFSVFLLQRARKVYQ